MRTVKLVIAEIEKLKGTERKLTEIGEKIINNRNICEYMEKEFGVTDMFFLLLANEYKSRADMLEKQLHNQEVDI